MVVEPPVPAIEESPFNSSLSFNTRLTLNSGVLFDLRKRRIDYRAAVLVVEEVEARIRRDVEKAYFFLVSTELELENKAQAIRLASERLRLAQFRFEQGLGSELDVLRAQMSKLNTTIAYEKAGADHKKRKMAFRRQLGLDTDVPFSLVTTINIPGADPKLVAEAAIGNRIDIKQAALAIESASLATTRYAATNRLPLFTVETGWNIGVTDLETTRDSFSITAAVLFNADAWVPGSRKTLELNSLRDTEKRLAHSYEQVHRNAIDDVNALLLDLTSARSSISVATAQLELAERIYEQTTIAWERGAATSIELEDARYSVDAALQSLVSGRYQYLTLLIDLGYSLNVDWRTLTPTGTEP